jgi:hypothetical protein
MYSEKRRKKGLVLMDLLLYLSLCTVIFASAVSLSYFCKMKKIQIQNKTNSIAIGEFLMFSKEYCLSNGVMGTIVLDFSNNLMYLMGENSKRIKELKLEEVSLSKSSSFRMISISTQGRITSGGTISFEDENKVMHSITIGVGSDTIGTE